MANLIDSSYFKGEIVIAQREQAGVEEKINTFIAIYEKKFLIQLLGKTVYEAFIAGLSADPVPAEWLELKDILVDSDLKQSPIANYVYWFFSKNEMTRTAGTGETKMKAENATIVDPFPKMVRAWNEIGEWCLLNRQVLYDFYVQYDLKPFSVTLPYCYPFQWPYSGYNRYHLTPFPVENSLDI